MEEQSIPEKLIKYYRCDKNSCDALLNNYLWAAYPLQFNDPFDCSEKFWDINSFSYETVINTITEIKNDEEFKKQFTIEQSNFRRRRLFIELFAPGVICLNQPCIKREDLLWGYYTNHEGFSVEFDRLRLQKEFKTAQFTEIDYDCSIFTNHRKGRINNFLKDYIRWAKCKKKIWVNEQEFRFIFHFDECNGYHPIFNMGDKRFRQKKYSQDAISSIILGYRFFSEQIHTQRKRSMTYNTDVYEFLPQDNSYKLHILTYAYGRGIDLYHIDLTEKFEFIKRKIEILEIKSNKVSINYKGIIK